MFHVVLKYGFPDIGSMNYAFTIRHGRADKRN